MEASIKQALPTGKGNNNKPAAPTSNIQNEDTPTTSNTLDENADKVEQKAGTTVPKQKKHAKKLSWFGEEEEQRSIFVLDDFTNTKNTRPGEEEEEEKTKNNPTAKEKKTHNKEGGGGAEEEMNPQQQQQQRQEQENVDSARRDDDDSLVIMDPINPDAAQAAADAVEAAPDQTFFLHGKIVGNVNDGAAANNNSNNNPTKSAVDIINEAYDDDDDDTFSEEEAYGFEAWAWVYFQGRRDRSEQQIRPTNSKVISRDSCVFVVVDPDGTELRLYPDENDRRLIIDPPIQLKYFFAKRVPGSQSGAALFLRNDDRHFRRYIFRFQFRNDLVLQPRTRIYQLVQASKAVKKSHYFRTVMKRKLKKEAMAMFSSAEEQLEKARYEEKKSDEAHAAYLRAINEMVRNGSVAADSFVGIVNEAIDDATFKMHSVSWGAGYEDKKEMTDESSDDESYSSESDYDDDLYDDDEDEDGKKKMENVQQSFERVFRPVITKLKKT